VGVGVIIKEEVLILSVGFAPLLVLGIREECGVLGSLEVSTVSHQQFLEVGVVKHIGVHSPPV
jgi:hypothetical protein